MSSHILFARSVLLHARDLFPCLLPGNAHTAAPPVHPITPLTSYGPCSCPLISTISKLSKLTLTSSPANSEHLSLLYQVMDDDLKIKDIKLAVDSSGQKTYQTPAYNAAGTIGIGRLDADTSWWTRTCIKVNTHTKDIPEVPSSQLHGTSQLYTTYLPWETLPASC